MPINKMQLTVRSKWK